MKMRMGKERRGKRGKVGGANGRKERGLKERMMGLGPRGYIGGQETQLFLQWAR